MPERTIPILPTRSRPNTYAVVARGGIELLFFVLNRRADDLTG